MSKGKCNPEVLRILSRMSKAAEKEPTISKSSEEKPNAIASITNSAGELAWCCTITSRAVGNSTEKKTQNEEKPAKGTRKALLSRKATQPLDEYSDPEDEDWVSLQPYLHC